MATLIPLRRSFLVFVVALMLDCGVFAQCNQWQAVDSPWGYVYAVTSFQGQLIASGALYGPGEVVPMARLNESNWEPMGQGLFDGAASSFLLFDDQLHAVARVENGGLPEYAVVRWDGSKWNALGDLTSSHSPRLVVFNGNLVASGDHVSKWDGRHWSRLGNASAGDMAEYSGHLVAITGLSSSGACVSRWDGRSWQVIGTFTNAFDNPPSLEVLSIYRDELIVGGYFTSVDGEPANNVARWDGRNWHGLAAGVDDGVFALLPRDDELNVGGTFFYAGGELSNAVARWNGTDWIPIGNSNGGIVFDFTVHNGEVIAGGLLYAPGSGSVMHGIDRRKECCTGDVTSDGQVNVNDLLAIINAWGGCPSTGACPADVNHDAQVNVNDLLAVINAWGPCT